MIAGCCTLVSHSFIASDAGPSPAAQLRATYTPALSQIHLRQSERPAPCVHITAVQNLSASPRVAIFYGYSLCVARNWQPHRVRSRLPALVFACLFYTHTHTHTHTRSETHWISDYLVTLLLSPSDCVFVGTGAAAVAERGGRPSAL